MSQFYILFTSYFPKNTLIIIKKKARINKLFKKQKKYDIIFIEVSYLLNDNLGFRYTIGIKRNLF